MEDTNEDFWVTFCAGQENDVAPDEKESKIGLFDFVNDITSQKRGVFDEKSERQYPPFMINKAMSQNKDTALLANELNKAVVDDKQMHYDFLFWSVPARKRYGKWAKAEPNNEELLAGIKSEFECSTRIAKRYEKVMKDTEKKRIMKKYTLHRSTIS